MQRFVQLALDFLAGTEPPDRVAAPPVRSLVVSSADPMHPVSGPADWQHPRANRRVRLADCDVAYEFKRGKRRTIGLSVGPEGLSVRAPRWTTVGEVEAFIHDKSGWVLDKLRAARERASALEHARTVWADGASFDFLGRRVRIQLDPAQARGTADALLEPAPQAGGEATLYLGLAHNASEAQIRDAAQAWLMRQALQVFTESLARFSPQLGVSYQKLRLSSAGTRWGSASADGTIRLNWRLIHLKPEMIDYVVVHELSHLRHMDHSPQFWDVVASVMPDHLERRKALKSASLR